MTSGRGLEGDGPGPTRRGGALRSLAYALLLGEVVVILIPSVYGYLTPKLFGIPFFYWFQLLWIIVGMVVTGIAYLLYQRAEVAAGAAVGEPEGPR